MRFTELNKEILEVLDPEKWTLKEHIKFWLIKKLEKKVGIEK